MGNDAAPILPFPSPTIPTIPTMPTHHTLTQPKDLAVSINHTFSLWYGNIWQLISHPKTTVRNPLILLSLEKPEFPVSDGSTTGGKDIHLCSREKRKAAPASREWWSGNRGIRGWEIMQYAATQNVFAFEGKLNIYYYNTKHTNEIHGDSRLKKKYCSSFQEMSFCPLNLKNYK